MANNELLAVGTSLQSYVKFKTPKYSDFCLRWLPTYLEKRPFWQHKLYSKQKLLVDVKLS